MSVSISNLTSGLPKEFGELLDYSRNIHFSEEPDYRLIRNLLEQALLNSGKELNMESFYCWEEDDSEENEGVKEM